MPNSYDYLQATANRALGLKARGDIFPIRVAYGNQESFVLKDPLTLEVYQLSAAECFLFEELREDVSLAELQLRFQAKFAPHTISLIALQQAVAQLFDQGLLVSTAPGQGQELFQRATKRRRSERWQNLLSLLSFRIVSWDASALIDTLYSRLRWIYSPVVGLAAICLVIYACLLVVGHGTKIFASMPLISELTNPNYLCLWMLTLVGVKVLHELGHALTCRHVGARCSEMGILLLALFPCLYCDVSDVWRLANKWQRIAVSAAGMIVELLLAASALALSWHTEPGLLHTWLLGLVILCSINTLVVNANPLLRYDGYFLLADLLEIPNLSGRASAWWREHLKDWLLGQPRAADPLITDRQNSRLAVYAVAARIYGIVILIAIFAVLLSLARPYHLESLVYLFAAVIVIGMILGPCVGVWKFLRNPVHRYHLRKPRLALVGITLASLVAAILFFPLRRTVEGPAVFVPAEGYTLYATEPGQLEFALAAGTEVKAGETVARLRNPDVEISLAQYRGELAEKQMQLGQLKTLRALDSKWSLRLPTAQAELQDAESQLAHYEQRALRLDVRSPVAGMVIAPPEIEAKAAMDRLPAWSGTALDQRNENAWIEPGTVLCTIGDPQRCSALVMVDERDIAEVDEGDPVRILLTSPPVRILSGTVSQVASRATIPSPSRTKTSLENNRVHLIEVQLDEQSSLAILGAQGRAKIQARQTTLAQLAKEFFRRRLRLPW